MKLIIVLFFISLKAIASEAKQIKILTSTSLFANFIEEICQNHCQVTSLAKPGQDPHLFEITPQSLKSLKDLSLIIYNGSNFEPGFEKTIQNHWPQTPNIKLIQQIRNPLQREDDSTEIDPHAWMDPQNAILYLDLITKKLSDLLPDKKNLFVQNKNKIQKIIQQKNIYWKDKFARLKNKKILTSHDAFQYFAKAFGLKIISAQGWSTESEIKPQTLSSIIKQVKSEKIPVLFLESNTNDKIVKQIAHETGAVIGGTLCADNLTLQSSSYVSLLEANAETIFKALEKAQ